MTTLKCPKCGSNEMLLTERRMDGDSICQKCSHQGPTFTFQTKRDEAVASNPFEINQRQLEAATVENQKLHREIIGLKQQVHDLKVAVAKLKAIKKELRNIIDLQREASR